jgi:hypothetical protein
MYASEPEGYVYQPTEIILTNPTYEIPKLYYFIEVPEYQGLQKVAIESSVGNPGQTPPLFANKVRWVNELSKFVVTGQSPFITSKSYTATSEDGRNWVRAINENEDTYQVDGISYDFAYAPSLNRLVYTVALNTPNPNYVVISDNAGQSFYTSSVAREMVSVAWSEPEQIFVACNGVGQNSILTSTNGLSWVSQSVPPSIAFSLVHWSDYYDKFFVFGLSGSTALVVTSSNGVNFGIGYTFPTVGTINRFTEVAENPTNGTLVVGLDSFTFDGVATNVVRFSENTWTPILVNNTNGSIEDVIYVEEQSKFIFCDSVKPSQSLDDGLTWQGMPLIDKNVERYGLNVNQIEYANYQVNNLHTIAWSSPLNQFVGMERLFATWFTWPSESFDMQRLSFPSQSVARIYAPLTTSDLPLEATTWYEWKYNDSLFDGPISASEDFTVYLGDTTQSLAEGGFYGTSSFGVEILTSDVNKYEATDALNVALSEASPEFTFIEEVPSEFPPDLYYAYFYDNQRNVLLENYEFERLFEVTLKYVNRKYVRVEYYLYNSSGPNNNLDILIQVDIDMESSTIIGTNDLTDTPFTLNSNNIVQNLDGSITLQFVVSMKQPTATDVVPISYQYGNESPTPGQLDLRFFPSA